jgi:hypothetical protein
LDAPRCAGGTVGARPNAWLGRPRAPGDVFWGAAPHSAWETAAQPLHSTRCPPRPETRRASSRPRVYGSRSGGTTRARWGSLLRLGHAGPPRDLPSGVSRPSRDCDLVVWPGLAPGSDAPGCGPNTRGALRHRGGGCPLEGDSGGHRHAPVGAAGRTSSVLPHIHALARMVQATPDIPPSGGSSTSPATPLAAASMSGPVPPSAAPRPPASRFSVRGVRCVRRRQVWRARTPGMRHGAGSPPGSELPLSDAAAPAPRRLPPTCGGALSWLTSKGPRGSSTGVEPNGPSSEIRGTHRLAIVALPPGSPARPSSPRLGCHHGVGRCCIPTQTPIRRRSRSRTGYVAQRT